MVHGRDWWDKQTAEDLFKMAIRTPVKKTFPGNLTVIPSGRRWVFYSIYKLAFVALYLPITCSRNRLALTDEDSSEFGPFESLIKTSPEFENSKLSLCTFHGIWGPFKEKVFPKLPKKSGKGNLLTSEGEDWGECFF